MVDIKEEIVNWGHGGLSPWMFAVHSTANPGATARNHRDLWSRGYDYAVHLVSDWHEAIHCVPYDRLCWQVGNGNATCEGLEICEATNTADFRTGIDIAADVIAQRLKARGWGIDRMHPHQWFSRVYGGSDHTDPIPYFSRFGYSWDQFTQLVQAKMNGEDMAISADDAKRIAAEVWSYSYKGSDTPFNQLFMHVASQTAGKVATYNWTDSKGQGGCYGGNLYNEIKGIWERADRNEKALAQLTALVAAQQTALDTLAKSLGANPADIAEIVAQAVTAKLDSIDVTFTATSK